MEQQDATEVRALAHSLDCITDEELQVLADATPGTVEAWRKRGKGPKYILFGNRYLYPRKGLAEHLNTLVRERTICAKDAL